MDAYLLRVHRLARFQRALLRQVRPQYRSLRTAAAIPQAETKRDVPTLATLPTCPSPDCACEPLPELPEGLEIDRTSKLDGTMAPYDAHIIVCTGRSDWPSKIEDDEGLPEVGLLKKMFGRGGKYANPYYNILISTSDDHKPSSTGRGISLFPSGVSLALHDSGKPLEKAVDHLVKSDILPLELSARARDMIAKDQHSSLVRVSCTEHSHGGDIIREPTILICGHGNRDQRCGIIGPVLKRAFEAAVRKHPPASPTTPKPNTWEPSIGLISHIGGHKFAGNVILYIPNSAGWQDHPLKGMGIWYGRVEPKHVEAVVTNTILRGAIIKDLFRGGIDGKGGILKLGNVETVISSSNA